MFELLRYYEVVGFDFDKTLIEGDNSELLWEFIQENPFDQTFHIVTFRSGGYEKAIWEDLRFAGSPLTPANFSQVFACSHDMWNQHKIRKATGVSDHDDPFLTWKGETCAKYGIEVLIDDDLERVSRGCEMHNITLIHPNSLTLTG